MSQFHKNIQALTKRYSYQELADLLGVSKRSISNYVEGENAHQSVIRKAEELLGKVSKADMILQKLDYIIELLEKK